MKNGHEAAVVPIESWAYNSPELRTDGRLCDIGLFAEALLYYDRILLNPSTPEHFTEIVREFRRANALKTLVRLIEDDVIRVLDFAFWCGPIQGKSGIHELWNMQDELQAKPNSFPERYLSSRLIREACGGRSNIRQLEQALGGKVIEVKAADFGGIPLGQAREDYFDDRINSLILQSFVDHIYDVRGLPEPPQVRTAWTHSADGSSRSVKWNVDISALKSLVHRAVNLTPSSTMQAAVQSNRLLWIAKREGTDLVVGSPLACVIGDKLDRARDASGKIPQVIQSLAEAVEFPDIRSLVNQGTLSIVDVLTVRDKCVMFRRWLQSEAQRDRDAIIAYHNEAATESGLKKFGRKSLRVFGFVASTAAGAVVNKVVGGDIGPIAGSATVAVGKWLTDLGAGLGENWKPVVFGNWFRDWVEVRTRRSS